MSDADFARIVRRALLMIVMALEKKYPEIAPPRVIPDHRPPMIDSRVKT